MYMSATANSQMPLDNLVEPYFLNHFEKKIDVARAQRYARVLYRDYHYNVMTKHLGHKPEEWRLPEGLIGVIEQIQKQMRK